MVLARAALTTAALVPMLLMMDVLYGSSATTVNSSSVSSLPSLILIYIDGDQSETGYAYWDYDDKANTPLHCLVAHTPCTSNTVCTNCSVISAENYAAMTNCYTWATATTCSKCDYGYGLA